MTIPTQSPGDEPQQNESEASAEERLRRRIQENKFVHYRPFSPDIEAGLEAVDYYAPSRFKFPLITLEPRIDSLEKLSRTQFQEISSAIDSIGEALTKIGAELPGQDKVAKELQLDLQKVAEARDEAVADYDQEHERIMQDKAKLIGDQMEYVLNAIKTLQQDNFNRRTGELQQRNNNGVWAGVVIATIAAFMACMCAFLGILVTAVGVGYTILR